MANNLLDISYITNEALVLLENDLVIAGKVTREYSSEFAVNGAKIGYTVNIRRPPRYKGTFGPGLNVEDTNETYVPVTLTSQFHVDVQFTTADLALAMDMFKKRVLSKMIAAVANRVDSDTYQHMYQNTAASVGTPGVSPASYLLFAQAKAQLRNEAAPADDDYYCVLDPLSMAVATDSIKGLFNPQATLGGYIEKGAVARKFAGLDWFEDQNVAAVALSQATGNGSPICGTLANSTALLATGWAANGYLYTTGWSNTTAVLQVGDVIQVAGVFPVNPQNRLQYGRTLRQFTVLPPGGYLPVNGPAASGISYGTATLPNSGGTFNNLTGVYTSSGSGVLSVFIGDAIISGGQFQNVTAAPALSAVVTVNGGVGAAAFTSPQGLVFHKNAEALAFADLPLPHGVEMAARSFDDEVGMSIRCVSQYTISNDAMPTRCDVLYGPANLYRSLGCRVAG